MVPVPIVIHWLLLASSLDLTLFLPIINLLFPNTLESLDREDQFVMEDDKEGDVSSHCFAPLQVPEGLALSDSEKVEALADSLEAQVSLMKTCQIWQLLEWLMR